MKHGSEAELSGDAFRSMWSEIKAPQYGARELIPNTEIHKPDGGGDGRGNSS